MNILFAYTDPFHPERGGVGRVTNMLTLELQKRGYNVFYLIYDVGFYPRWEYDYPAPLTYLPSKEATIAENVRVYREYLEKHKIDIVINQSGLFSESKLWLDIGNLNVRVISVLHSTPWLDYKYLWYSQVYPLRNDSFKEKLKRLARIVIYLKLKRDYYKCRLNHIDWLLPKADILCMLSRSHFAEINEIYGSDKYKYKYRSIPNPNSYTEERLAPTNCPKKKQLLFVGRFSHEKRMDVILKIWNKIGPRYPDWELIMVGDSKNKALVSRLKRMVRGLSNVRFTGFCDPLPYQQSASICCMTSSYEGLPMVLTEAMQCGCVPMAFDSFGALRDIIEHGRNGVIVKPFDIKAYTRELCRLMDDTEYREKLAANARQDVQRFSVEKVADQWEELFNEVDYAHTSDSIG